MQYGTVKFFHNTKKFGFVTTESGEDIFFHITGIVTGEPDENDRSRALFIPEEGERVSFEIVDTEKGPKAINVDRADAPMGGAVAQEIAEEDMA